ncbi:hypothetical protein J7L01_07325 [bacterium]|nr:hypothetical protein [bacterium]
MATALTTIRLARDGTWEWVGVFAAKIVVFDYQMAAAKTVTAEWAAKMSLII